VVLRVIEDGGSTVVKGSAADVLADGTASPAGVDAGADAGADAVPSASDAGRSLQPLVGEGSVLVAINGSPCALGSYKGAIGSLKRMQPPVSLKFRAPPRMCGELVKRREGEGGKIANVLKSWNVRFFELKEGTLSYYAKEGDAEVKGCYKLHGALVSLCAPEHPVVQAAVQAAVQKGQGGLKELAKQQLARSHSRGLSSGPAAAAALVSMAGPAAVASEPAAVSPGLAGAAAGGAAEAIGEGGAEAEEQAEDEEEGAEGGEENPQDDGGSKVDKKAEKAKDKKDKKDKKEAAKAKAAATPKLDDECCCLQVKERGNERPIVMRARTVEEMLQWAAAIAESVALVSGGGYILQEDIRFMMQRAAGWHARAAAANTAAEGLERKGEAREAEAKRAECEAAQGFAEAAEAAVASGRFADEDLEAEAEDERLRLAREEEALAARQAAAQRRAERDSASADLEREARALIAGLKGVAPRSADDGAEGAGGAGAEEAQEDVGALCPHSGFLLPFQGGDSSKRRFCMLSQGQFAVYDNRPAQHGGTAPAKHLMSLILSADSTVHPLALPAEPAEAALSGGSDVVGALPPPAASHSRGGHSKGSGKKTSSASAGGGKKSTFFGFGSGQVLKAPALPPPALPPPPVSALPPPALPPPAVGAAFSAPALPAGAGGADEEPAAGNMCVLLRPGRGQKELRLRCAAPAEAASWIRALRAVAADMSRAEIGIEGPLKVSEGRYALSGTQMVQRALGGGEAWNRVHCVLSCEDVFAFRFGEGISAAPLSARSAAAAGAAGGPGAGMVGVGAVKLPLSAADVDSDRSYPLRFNTEVVTEVEIGSNTRNNAFALRRGGPGGAQVFFMADSAAGKQAWVAAMSVRCSELAAFHTEHAPPRALPPPAEGDGDGEPAELGSMGGSGGGRAAGQKGRAHALSLASMPSERRESPSHPKHGWLIKRARSGVNWRRRFFVLTGSTLAYYKEESDAEPQGAFQLTPDCSCHRSLQRPHAFVLVTPGGVLHAALPDRDQPAAGSSPGASLGGAALGARTSVTAAGGPPGALDGGEEGAGGVGAEFDDVAQDPALMKWVAALAAHIECAPLPDQTEGDALQLAALAKGRGSELEVELSEGLAAQDAPQLRLCRRGEWAMVADDERAAEALSELDGADGADGAGGATAAWPGPGSALVAVNGRSVLLCPFALTAEKLRPLFWSPAVGAAAEVADLARLAGRRGRRRRRRRRRWRVRARADSRQPARGARRGGRGRGGGDGRPYPRRAARRPRGARRARCLADAGGQPGEGRARPRQPGPPQLAPGPPQRLRHRRHRHRPRGGAGLPSCRRRRRRRGRRRRWRRQAPTDVPAAAAARGRTQQAGGREGRGVGLAVQEGDQRPEQAALGPPPGMPGRGCAALLLRAGGGAGQEGGGQGPEGGEEGAQGQLGPAEEAQRRRPQE
jgi:hypothetical protein